MANAAELASLPSVPKPVVRTPEPDQVRRMLSTMAKVDSEFAVSILGLAGPPAARSDPTSPTTRGYREPALRARTLVRFLSTGRCRLS